MEKEKERERGLQVQRAQPPSLDLDPDSDDARPPMYRSPFGSSSSMGSQQHPAEHDEEQMQHPHPIVMRQINTDLASLSYTNPPGNQHSRSNTFRSNATGSSGRSKQSKQSRGTGSGSGTPISGRSKFTEGIDEGYGDAPAPAAPAAVELHRRPTYQSSGSSTTLVGSALERKMNDQDMYQQHDTTDRLNALREYMKKDNLDY